MAKTPRLWSVAAASMCAAIAALIFSCSGGDGMDVDDDTYPSQVKDLRVTAVTPATVVLEWTAPGDDDTVGTAAEYDLRYKTGSLSWEDWDAAIPVSGEPDPSAFGSADSMVVTGLMEDSTYYFGIKTKGHGGNWSWLSNIPTATCFDDFVVTFLDARLDEIMRTKIAIPTGAIHRSDLLPVTQLFANDQTIANLSGLEYCVNLDVILMWSNQVSNLSPLSGLVKMRVLQIGHNQIADISPLAGLVNLEQIHLHENYNIADISALAGMTKLSDVHLAGNNISNIGALSGKTAMTMLVLERNDISDVSPLAGMTELTHLNLYDNQVSDISPLAASTKMVALNLWQNDVSDISVIAGMTMLEELYLIGNQIANIGALENLAALQKLYLSENPALADISALSGLTALADLQIQSCAVIDVTALQGLPNLQKLVLDNNQIADIAPLAANMGLGDGDFLYLQGNPLSKESIDVHIPTLQGRGVTVAY